VTGQRGSAANHDHAAARPKRLEQSIAQPVERDPDIGLPVDRERLPRLLLQRTRERACVGHQNHGLRLIAVEEAAGHRGVTGIGDLRLDGAGAVGRLRKRRRGVGHGDHRGAGLGEGRRDSRGPGRGSHA
jgi:hypothetical protein